MLLAVHISDGVLAAPWWVGGFVVATLLLWLGARRIRDDEIPRVALLTAAFFVASLVHVRVGPTSVHLLLNGLVGVLLGTRAALAILLGLLLQVVLIQHGGFTTLGVNACILTLPALLSFVAFRGLNRLPWLKAPVFRSVLVGVASAVWFLSGVYGLSLLHTNILSQLDYPDLGPANANLLHPLSLLGAVAFAVGVAWFERRLENAPEFPLGLLVGELTVLLTVGLNCVVLIAGGEENWSVQATVWVLVHLPIAVVEGVILGFAVGFLAKVRPEMVGLPRREVTWAKKV